MPPMLVRVIRYSLIGLGAITLMSAVINIVGAVALFTPIEEDSLGVSRREVILWFIGPALLGVALMIFGFLWRRKKH